MYMQDQDIVQPTYIESWLIEGMFLLFSMCSYVPQHKLYDHVFHHEYWRKQDDISPSKNQALCMLNHC